jgi:hypothetical protein
LEEREFLICVKTYPEYSAKYIETVCTAAVLKDTGKLIRLYPIPYRYLVGDSQFRKYQWVRAKIQKNLRDGRPESYRVLKDSIQLGGSVGTQKGWLARRKLILSQPGNLFGSLEDLQKSQEVNKTSLGIIKPRKIAGFKVQKKTATELAEEEQKKRSIMAQLSFAVEKKELDLMPYRFLISFACDHQACTGHNISILDWEFGQLYRNVMKSANWEEKIKGKLEQICSKEKDVYFFMGNMASRRNIFCILGIFYPPKIVEEQLNLFTNQSACSQRTDA